MVRLLDENDNLKIYCKQEKSQCYPDNEKYPNIKKMGRGIEKSVLYHVNENQFLGYNIILFSLLEREDKGFSTENSVFSPYGIDRFLDKCRLRGVTIQDDSKNCFFKIRTELYSNTTEMTESLTSKIFSQTTMEKVCNIELGKPSKKKNCIFSELFRKGGGGVYSNPNFKNISNLEL